MSERKASERSPQIPTKWAVAIVAVLIGYALLQPVLNSRLGWHLPSLAALLGQEEAVNRDSKPQAGHEREKSSQASASSTSAESDSEIVPNVAGTLGATSDDSQTPEPTTKKNGAPANTTEASSKSNPDPPKQTGSQTIENASQKPPEKAAARAPPAKSDSPSIVEDPKLRYGFLRELAADDYISPAGLRYTRGSAEGHRLAHIERHLKDDPGRPGKHGVFDGDMQQVLRWLDEAYELAKRGAKGTRKSTEDGRTVFEAGFSKPIGYIGGRDGKRSNNPDARRIRLVVDGNKVITAFPF